MFLSKYRIVYLTLQVTGVCDAILAAVDASTLGLNRDAVVMADAREYLSLGQILFVIVMTHVDHDRIERQVAGNFSNLILILGVVEVQCDRYAG